MIHKNLKTNDLINMTVSLEKSIITRDGVLCTYTGQHTGRSPNAKKYVLDSLTENTIDWKENNSISAEEFEKEHIRFINYKNYNDVFLQEVSAVRDTTYALKVKIYTQYAKHSLFCRNMFIPTESTEIDIDFVEDYNVYHFPILSDTPQVLISFEKKVILISGTLYSGEIKKSVFSVLNYLFPQTYNFLPMHCSVNVDKSRKNPTIFFGLSGTGKTTLSSDENRILIGDDEHVWTDRGISNFEGGCYAKTIRLSSQDEPQIWKACHTRGAILENVVVTNDGVDFNSAKFTENSRASYPTDFIDNADTLGFVDEHPKNIVMLTCDAFGVLPPVAKLDADEAVRQFLLGYTAKVAGTESGISEPVATFSPCFGLPFMPLVSSKYGEILRLMIEKHNVNCWLVNTGWIGGPYGVGKRIPIKITRAIINLINYNILSEFETLEHPYTNFSIPKIDLHVPPHNLNPENGWKDKIKYQQDVQKLLNMFRENNK